MASKLEEFREQYPQYSDWTDEELAGALHQQYYPEMDQDAYRSELGMSEPAAPPVEPTFWQRVKDKFSSAQDEPAAILDDKPSIADDFEMEPEAVESLAEMEAMDVPGYRPQSTSRYSRRKRARELRETAQRERELIDKQPMASKWDHLFAGYDEYRANRADAAGFTAIEDYNRAEDVARGRVAERYDYGGAMGVSAQQIGRQIRQSKAEMGDLNAQAKILEEVDANREQLIDDLQGYIDEGAERRQRAESVPFAQQTQEFVEAQGLGQATAEFLDQPGNIIMELSIRSLPNMVESVPLAIVGSVAGPAGFAAGLGAGSAMTEYRASFSEYMRHAGVDMSSARAMMDAAENEELMKAAHAYSFKRSAVVGTFDTATGGLATKTIAPAVKSVLARELANVAAQTGIQAAGGAGQEIVAQAWTLGEGPQPENIQWGQVGAETVAELGTATIEVGTATLTGLNADYAKMKAARIEAEAESMLGGNRADPSPDADTGPPRPPADPVVPDDPEGTPAPDDTDLEPDGPGVPRETIVRLYDENWTVQVDQAYDNGERDVTIKDEAGNTTRMRLKPGESLSQAVEMTSAQRGVLVGPPREPMGPPREPMGPPTEPMGPPERVGPPAPPREPREPGEPETRLRDFMDSAIRRFQMEEQGQAILDDLAETGRSPQDVSEEFWADTWLDLNDTTKRKFEGMLKGLGFTPGDVVATTPQGPITANSWEEIGSFIGEDLSNEPGFLEGTERGYVALMEWANEQRRAQEPTAPQPRGAVPEIEPPGGAPAPAGPVVEPTPPDETPPAWIDNRLKRRDFRAALQGMADEIVEGGGAMGTLVRKEAYPGETMAEGEASGEVTNRLPSENPQWFQDMAATPETKIHVKELRTAVAKALTGKKLGVRQARVVQAMLDLYTDERTQPDQIDYAKRMLQEARDRRLAARMDAGQPLDPFADIRGEMYYEDEYDPDMSAESRQIFELMTEAGAVGVPEDVLERLAIQFDDNQALMNELEATINEYRREAGAQAAPAQPERRADADTQETSAAPDTRPKRKKLTAIQQDAYDQLTALNRPFTGRELLNLEDRVGVSRQHSVNTISGLVAKGYIRRTTDVGKIDSTYEVIPEDQVQQPPSAYNLPWGITRRGDGDLYVQRIGPNAGTVSRTRTSDNDLAITLDPTYLLPDYAFYLLQMLQPQIAARATGVAQQTIRADDVSEVLIQHFETQAREWEQLELYFDADVVGPQENAPRLEEAKADALDALASLRATPGVTARGISSEFAKNQRVSLVGQWVPSAGDLAVLAQVYRDPRFETLRLLFVDRQDKIVSQLGLTGRLPASATALVGPDLDQYLTEVSERAAPLGATKAWMLHNHPSGDSTASHADEKITVAYQHRLQANGIQLQGHVIIDENQFAEITPLGESLLFRVDLNSERFKPAGGIAGEIIAGPANLIGLVKHLEPPENETVLVVANQRHEVINVTTIANNRLSNDPARVRRVVQKAILGQIGGSRAFAVGSNDVALRQLSGVVVDSIRLNDDGSITSLRADETPEKISFGDDPFPIMRPARVSPDSSPEFDYLRPFALQIRQELADRRAGKEPGQGTMEEWLTAEQEDLFGDVSKEQALADEIRRRDKKRNSGQESAEIGESGDLFSDASKQMDIEDQVESRRGRYDEDDMRSSRVRKMTMEELVNSVYQDELTGIGNLKAYNEEIRFLPVQASVDADNLKWINDNLGPDAGDAMLVGIAKAIDQDGVEAYRIGGDEFIVAGDNEIEVRAALELAEGILANQAIENEKGRAEGIRITWATGRDRNHADTILKSKKVAKEKAGQRAPRGERPPNVVLAAQKPTSMPNMEAGTNYVPLIGKHGRLPITPNHELVLGNGRIVRIPKKPVKQAHVLALMRKYFGNRIYQGRMKGRMALGFFRPGHGEIRLKHHNDAEVASHEIAHFLDDRFPWIRKLYMKHKDEMKGVSYDVEKVFEGYAEFMRLFFTQESLAMSRAPGFYDAWRNALKDHKQLEGMVYDVQELLHAWIMQGARARGAGRVGDIAASWWEKFLNIWPDFNILQSALDGLRSVKQAELALGADPETMEAYEKLRIAMGGANSMLEAAFFWGTPGKRADGQGYEFTGKGLAEIFGNHWGDHDFGMYLLVKRAAELEFQGRESGFRPDEIRAWLEYERENPEAAGIYQEYQDFNDRMLDFAVQTGVISGDQKEAMQEANKNYTPFYRVIESTISGRAVRSGGNPFMRLKGSTRNVNVVWENIVNQVGMVVRTGLINDGKRTLLRKLGGTDRLGAGKRDNTAGLYAAPIKTDTRAVKITGDQVLRKAVEAMGWTMAQYRMAKEGFVESEDDLIVVRMIEEMEQNLGMFVNFFEVNIAPTGNVDYYMDAGDKHFYEIIDPGLWDSLQFLGPKGTNMVLSIMGGFSAALRRGVVAWPTFQTKNFVRDTINAWMLSSSVKIPAARALRIVSSRMSKDPMYQEMVLNGGGFANRVQGLNNQRKLIIDPTRLVSYYDRFMGRFENANRLAEYTAAREAGVGPRRAAILSRDISTDFAMRGSHQAARFLAIAIPFLNARAQGNYRLARTGSDYRATAISYAMRGAAVTTATLALYALNKDDERYKELPEDIKDLYWVYFYGEGEDDYVLLAKPFENGALFATIPERTFELVETENGKEFADAMGWLFLQTMQMDMEPQVFQPMMDLARNKDFTGAPIIPFHLENVEPDQQYTFYTSETMKEAGKKFGVSPMKMDYIMRGYLGTNGTYLLAASDAMIRAATDPYMDPYTKEVFPGGAAGERPTRGETWKENIVVRGLVDWAVTEGPPRRVKSRTDLYDMVREAEQVANTMALMQRRQSAEAEAYLDDPKNKFLMGLVRGGPPTPGRRPRRSGRQQPPLQGARAGLANINKQLEAIRIDPRLTGDEKRVQLWELIRERNELTREVMEAIRLGEEQIGEGVEPQSAVQGVSDVVAARTQPPGPGAIAAAQPGAQ